MAKVSEPVDTGKGWSSVAVPFSDANFQAMVRALAWADRAFPSLAGDTWIFWPSFRGGLLWFVVLP